MENQIVIFELGREHYGIPIEFVDSIVKMLPITGIPHAPDFIAGIINLRGKVLSVVNLRKRFGLPACEQENQQRIIVISMNENSTGMIVDGVSEVLTLPAGVIEPPPPMVTGGRQEWITGIARLGDQLVILLDLKKIFFTEQPDGTLSLPETVS